MHMKKNGSGKRFWTNFVSLSRRRWRVAKSRKGGRFEMSQSEETFKITHQ